MLLVDSKLKQTYLNLHEDNDDDDVLGGLDVLDKEMYLRGFSPSFNVTGDKTDVYKVDLTGVTPGSLTGEKLMKAFKLIRTHTPPPWQRNIQNEVNQPTTIKVGRNTVLKAAPAYKFDYNLAKNNNLFSPGNLYCLSYLQSKFGFNPQTAYFYLNYTPYDYKTLGYRDEVGPGVKVFAQQAIYDICVVGVTRNNEPMAFGIYPNRPNRKQIVYGPIQGIKYEDLTRDGLLYYHIEDLAKNSFGGTRAKYAKMLNDLSYGREITTTPKLESGIESEIKQNAHKIGIDGTDENL